jgi:two-component system NtrC family sensor kinase
MVRKKLKSVVTKKTKATEADYKRKWMIAERLRQEAVVQEKLHGAPQSPLNSGLFVAGVAHEFNNILGALKGHLEWALEAGTLDALKESAQLGLRACDRSVQITRSLSGLLRDDEGAKEILSFDEVVQDVVSLWKRIFVQNQATLSVSGSSGNIYANRARVFEVVLNLVKNALEAVSVEGEKKRSCDLRLSVDTRRRRCVLQVVDSGAGVSPALMSQLFQPFFTTKGVLSSVHDGFRGPGAASSSKNVSSSGMGLGLYLSREWIREAGGELSFVSKPRTTFIIELPQAKM